MFYFLKNNLEKKCKKLYNINFVIFKIVLYYKNLKFYFVKVDIIYILGLIYKKKYKKLKFFGLKIFLKFLILKKNF